MAAIFMTYALSTASGIHPYVALVEVLPVFFVSARPYRPQWALHRAYT
jgi:hypothetical protein